MATEAGKVVKSREGTALSGGEMLTKSGPSLELKSTLIKNPGDEGGGGAGTVVGPKFRFTSVVSAKLVSHQRGKKKATPGLVPRHAL